MIHTYLPNEIDVCSAYLLRHTDITTKQMPIIYPSGNMLTEILFSSEAIESGSYSLQYEIDGMPIDSIDLENGKIGQTFLPSNIVLPIGGALSLKYVKISGKIANLQINVLFKELC